MKVSFVASRLAVGAAVVIGLAFPAVPAAQAPRGQDVQAPRGEEPQAPRGEEPQAPRGQDVQAPRGEEPQAPRGQEAERACKAGDMTLSTEKAKAALDVLK